MGFAGADLKVLIGQITTTDDVTGLFNVQVFVNGIQDDQQLATDMTFSTNPADVFGCTDSDATNFDALRAPTPLTIVLVHLPMHSCIGFSFRRHHISHLRWREFGNHSS